MSRRTLESLPLPSVEISPDQTTTYALAAMREAGAFAAIIRSEESIVGVLCRRVAAAHPDALAGQACSRAFGLKSETELSEALKAMINAGAKAALVWRGKELSGAICAETLVQELDQFRDPLTDLPGGDRLREWGFERLRKGQELAIIFIDLDDFGRFNKRHGHVVGDRVISLVADLLREHVDPATDLLVRYAGDEFALATLRSHDDARGLARSLRSQSVPMSEIDDVVRFSVGVSGGKRTHMRNETHVAATLDSLITLASRSATEHKLAKKNKGPAGQPSLLDAIASDAEIEDAIYRLESDGEMSIEVLAKLADSERPEFVTASAPLNENTAELLAEKLELEANRIRNGRQVLADPETFLTAAPD